MDSAKWMDELGAAVKVHRKKAGLTQLELARLAGVGKTVVFDLEKGKETIRVATLLNILAALNMSLRLVSPLKSYHA